jgi:hypothetical protein
MWDWRLYGMGENGADYFMSTGRSPRSLGKCRPSAESLPEHSLLPADSVGLPGNTKSQKYFKITKKIFQK